MKPQISIKNTSENPFYGLRNCLNLLNSIGKGTVSESTLESCWAEVSNDKDKRKMFFSLLFSIGDITARHHNIFGKAKVDSGGNAEKDSFKVIMQWMKRRHYSQFVRFMFARLFNEFTSFDNLLAMRIRTKPKTAMVVNRINMTLDNPDLAKYLAKIIQGNNPFDKFLVAKFLTRPRTSKRKNHKKMLHDTKAMMGERIKLIKEVSDLCGFEYVQKEKYIEFTGFYQWKKQFNAGLESVLFSSQKVKEFDETEFKTWLNQLPSSARNRVKRRVLDKDGKERPKWSPIGRWFTEWEKFKEVKQQEVRVVEEKVRQGTATDDEKIKLKETKKEAKVTTGAIKFAELFQDTILGTVDKVKIQPFFDKFNLPYNNLVFIDDSGSMYGARHADYGFSAADFAAFMATICLMKNPDDTGRSLVGMFSSTTRMFTGIDAISHAPNGLVRGVSQKVTLPLYDPHLDFTANLHNMKAFMYAYRTGNGTNISSVPDHLHMWAKGDAEKIEQLQNFPVWTFISDGNFNNMYTPESSMNDFFYRCESYFGFRPFIILIDVAYQKINVDKFRGIQNLLYLPPNPAQIEQFLTNFTHIDIVDIYTPLLSLFRSNRYELVRENTL